MGIVLETSARHVHVTKETLETLFGENYELTKKKELSQPGQFAAEERIRVIGEKGEFPRVSILGPCRKADQVEMSASDARSIGIKAPIRESGDVKDSGSCKLVGPKGEVTLKEGVIIAKRHIHMTENDAKNYNVKNGEIVNVKVNSKDRALTFSDVVVRVSDSYALAMHIDTDESNACGATPGLEVEIVK